MATTIGEKLRLAREEAGVSLRDISEQTRISVRYLEAIEKDDYKRLPGGIFNRSFIKSYARHIGYDEKEAMESYLFTLRQKGEPIDELITAPKPLVYNEPGSGRSPLVTLLLAILILGVLSLAAYAALYWYQRRTTPVRHAPARTQLITTSGVASAPEIRWSVERFVEIAEDRSPC